MDIAVLFARERARIPGINAMVDGKGMTGVTLGPCNHVRKADLVVYPLRDGNNRAYAVIMDVPVVCIAHVAAIFHSETG